MQCLNKNCPICGGYVYINTIGTEICGNCGHVLPGSNFATSGYSHNSTNSAEKYCYNCNTKMESFGDGGWWECPNCHYGQMDYIGDPLQNIGDLYIKSDGVGSAWGRFDPDLIPYTLVIDTNLIKLRPKEMELEFELEPDKLKNIDTIIINGHKYIKDKTEEV